MAEHTRAATTLPLRNGQDATIRLLSEDDRERLTAFGRALSQDDLLYLETDFHSAEIIARLINASFAENWRQIVAEVDGKIIGYSAVRRLPGWSSHVADIVILVTPAWRRNGLGSGLAQAIFDAARELGATKVIVEMLEEQEGGRGIFERLGFSVEGKLVDHARDRHGVPHNLLILSYFVS